MEAIKEEGQNHLTFLNACGAALRANPPKVCGIMATPYHLLLGNAPTSALLSIPPGVSSPEPGPALQTPPSSAPAVTRHSPQYKQQNNLPYWVEIPSPLVATSNMAPEEPPYSRQKEKMSLHKALTRSSAQGKGRILLRKLPTF